MIRSIPIEDAQRSKELLKKLRVQGSPEHLDAVRLALSSIGLDQRTVDVELCKKIAVDVDGTLGEG
jgi:hypothetical protein